MFSALLAILFGGLFALSMRRDPRRVRNGVVLVLACLFAAGAAVEVVSGTLLGVIPFLGAVVVLPLSVVALAVFLVLNAILTARREGLSRATLFSGAAGAALLAMPVLVIVLLVSPAVQLRALAVVTALATAYVGCAFLVFLAWTLAYSRWPRGRDQAAIVVLGSGLIDGNVPPLLRGRLDAAIEQWRARPDALLVASGGQGDDEPRAEGEAMAEYLLAQGVPADRVLAETASRTTRQNLEFSRALLAERGIGGELLIVTSGYHAARAALLARRLGITADAVGARTAAYYVPSAYLREFVAVLAEHPIVSAVFAALAVAAGVGVLLIGS